MRVFLGVLAVFFALVAFSQGPILVRSEGESHVAVKGEDRAQAYHKALEGALFQAVKREVFFLEEDLATVESFMDGIKDRLKEFIVKYRVLEASFTPPQEGQSLEGGEWHIKVEVYIDSEYLQDALRSEGSILGG
jgi:hypothetical protein